MVDLITSRLKNFSWRHFQAKAYTSLKKKRMLHAAKIDSIV